MQPDIRRYKENLQSEQQAVLLYQKLAKAEPNPDLAEVYQRLAATEQKHVAFWSEKLRDAGVAPPPIRPGWRTYFLAWLARNAGTAAVLPTVAAMERNAAGEYDTQADAVSADLHRDEHSHARIFSYLTQNTQGIHGSDVARFEGRHRAAGGNALRAGVLGANDGLVSVFSLVMGVAGAGASSHQILITGFAGLLSGALSMALGEWLSVQSSRELYQHQIGVEKQELEGSPQEEIEELTLIYQAKGLEEASARHLAEKLLARPENALQTLVREELAIDPEELGGSSWEAAGASFLLFAFGAMIPVFPYLFLTGKVGIMVSAVVSAIGLWLIGASITLMTGKSPLISGLRQVVFGLTTAGVTYGIGWMIGVNLGG